MHPHAAVEVGVCCLFGRQLNVAADGAATGLFGAAVGRFHDPGAASGHDCESKPRNGRTHFSSEFVMRIVALNARRAENGYAWTDEVKRAKSAQKIAHHPQKGEKLGKTRTRPFEEKFVGPF